MISSAATLAVSPRRLRTRLHASRPLLGVVTGALLLLNAGAAAHEHHDEDLPAETGMSEDPIDAALWTHILLQISVWGIIFPLGMVLGMIRSRWHVPVQVVGTGGAIAGWWLGHHHGGRRFGHNVHSSYAPWLGWLLGVQIVLGIYLRLHIERGFLGRIRRVLVVAHGVVGKALPLAAWVQMLFGGIVALGFCRADHLGQCAAHFIMGSAFIAYGILLTILLAVGQLWLRRTGRSQEFFDSLIVTVWGCINTFTEHHWGDPWVKNDLQHTSMGVVWWCAGLVGMWLSRRRDGRPKRNIIPGIVILLTGYGMSAHPQDLPLSTMVHTAFGWTLMAAGAARIVEVSFVLKDKPALDITGNDPNSFQYLPPFLLYASGFLFMAATEEQMALVSRAEVTHVSYILLLYSMAFLMFLFVNVLIHLYAVHAFPPTATPARLEAAAAEEEDVGLAADGAATANGGLGSKYGHLHRGGANNGSLSHINGLPAGAASAEQRRRAKEAEEFELDALISDEEEDDDSEGEGRRRRHANGVAPTSDPVEGSVRLK